MAEICSDALFIPQGITSSLGSIAGFSSMTIKASPEIMEAKAADVLSAAAQIRREFEELFRAMGRTAGYWNGEAAELHRRRYADMKPEMVTCSSAWKNTPVTCRRSPLSIRQRRRKSR